MNELEQLSSEYEKRFGDYPMDMFEFKGIPENELKVLIKKALEGNKEIELDYQNGRFY